MHLLDAPRQSATLPSTLSILLSAFDLASSHVHHVLQEHVNQDTSFHLRSCRGWNILRPGAGFRPQWTLSRTFTVYLAVFSSPYLGCHSFTDIKIGDEEEITDLESRVAAFDPSNYWRERETLTMAMPYIKAESTSPSPMPATQLHNPYEGKAACAKQLYESIEGFLSRLPPATTDVDPAVPWIYVANPFIPFQDRGGEEAPVEFGADLEKFTAGGEKRLEMCSDFVRALEARAAIGGGSRIRGAPSKAKTTREVAKERAECVDDILMLAKLLKVRTGKVSLRWVPLLEDEC